MEPGVWWEGAEEEKGLVEHLLGRIREGFAAL